jgi:hypothetical protein
MYVRIYVCMYVHIYVCIGLLITKYQHVIYVYAYVGYMYIYIYIYIYIYTYTHTYIHTLHAYISTVFEEAASREKRGGNTWIYSQHLDHELFVSQPFYYRSADRYVHVCMLMYVWICMYIYLCLCMCVCMHSCINVCM